MEFSGEVALPSVKAEEGDADDAATALRESKEEIGLDPALVTIVTYLEHFLSKVQFLPFSVKAQWNIFSQLVTCRCINVIAAFPFLSFREPNTCVQLNQSHSDLRKPISRSHLLNNFSLTLR